MPPPFPLEEFKSAANRANRSARGDQPVAPVGAEALEKSRLAGYEAGYKAGWDDASQSETDEQTRIGAEFARNLQDLGFTFQEARSHVMHALEPLLAGMVEKVLPQLISETMGHNIVEELMPLAAIAADMPIEIVVPPSAAPILGPMLADATAIPFTLIEETTLAEGQIFLRSGKTEKHLDFSGVTERMTNAINDLYDLNERAFANG